tara:strand:+ start:5914 stop:6213 length:300 start_codon:yes stop_codon:yes gene_type:complete
VVGIDSDEKVKKDKGPTRPHNCVEDRKFALECVRYIDEVVVFDTRASLENLIKKVSPLTMVIGSDWEGKEVVGSQYVKNLKFFQRMEKYSTTKILGNMK